MPADLPSPLKEADPNSLQKYFSMDPLKMTDEDVEKITKELWSKQETWAKEEHVKKTTSSAPRAKKKTATSEDIKELMKDLGI